jgi:hypothetical protein
MESISVATHTPHGARAEHSTHPVVASAGKARLILPPFRARGRAAVIFDRNSQT